MKHSKNILEKIKKIEKIQTDQDLAKIFNVTKYAIYNWKARNSIPEDKLKNYCLMRGLNYEEFVGLAPTIISREPMTDYLQPVETKFPGLMDYLIYHQADFDYIISKHKIYQNYDQMTQLVKELKEKIEILKTDNTIWRTTALTLLNFANELLKILDSLANTQDLKDKIYELHLTYSKIQNDLINQLNKKDNI